jgi:hypothetical protein
LKINKKKKKVIKKKKVLNKKWIINKVKKIKIKKGGVSITHIYKKSKKSKYR